MTDENNAIESLSEKVAAYFKNLGREDNLFRLNATKAAFLAVDMQNFVCDPEPGRDLPNMGLVVSRVNRMADFCHGHGIPVIWIRQGFARNNGKDNVGLYGMFHKYPLQNGMFNHGKATEVYSGMHLDRDRDLQVMKTRYSAFITGSSPLEPHLSRLGKTQLIIAGVATNVCVESTVRDAMQLGYETTVLNDATTAFDELVHRISLLNIKMFFGDVRPVDSVIQELKESV